MPPKSPWQAPRIVRLDGIDHTGGKYAYTFVSESGHFVRAGGTRYGVYRTSDYGFNQGTGAPAS